MTVKHGTSSVIVVRPAAGGWRIGLILHPRLHRLMMPGGHVEDGESPEEAAVREVAEEAGLGVRLLHPPAPPLPAAYQPVRVAQPWWIVEYRVPADSHLGSDHVHVDHLYVAVTDDAVPATRPAHPFGWYASEHLPGLEMFADARTLANAILAGLNGAPVVQSATDGFPEPGPPRGGGRGRVVGDRVSAAGGDHGGLAGGCGSAGGDGGVVSAILAGLGGSG